jgi:hypothetical protein
MPEGVGGLYAVLGACRRCETGCCAGARGGPGRQPFVIRLLREIHPTAKKRRIADDDILHATRNAMTIDPQDDDTVLYLGAARSGELLEVSTILREDGTELVIHAMTMRRSYQNLLSRGV